MPKQTIRAPFATGDTEKLSKRVFRKQILKFGEIDYHGRVVRFDAPYATDVVKGFRDGAFDTVPFVLADTDNKHTRDPERVRGEIIDLEATDTGLDAVISLTGDAAKLVDENPKLGVSVSIKEQFQRADGKFFPAALAHVLGTFEPMLPGMSPWQTINASMEDEEVLDLTTIDLASPKTKEKGMPKYTDDERDALFDRMSAFLANFADLDNDPGREDDEDEDLDNEQADEDEDDEDLSPEDIELMREFLAQVDAGELQVEETVNASQQDDARTVELSNALQAQSRELRALRAENDRRAFEQERDQIARDFSIPPFIVDLARPLLQGSGHSVELSDTGKKVDAGQVVREVFKALGQQIQLLDLSGEIGNNLDFSQADEEDHSVRVSKIQAVRKQMNI